MTTTILTTRDVQRLTMFKWRYSLESAGFTTYQIDYLMFLKWAHRSRRIAP